MNSLKQLTRYRNICRRATTRARKFSIQSSNTIPDDFGYNFKLTASQREYRDLAREFTRREIIPKAAYHDQTGEFPIEIFKKAHSVGLLNGQLPEFLGGLNHSNFVESLLNEEVCYGCMGISTAIQSPGLAQTPLLLCGTKEQQKKYLGRMVDEPISAAYCVTEPGTGSDVAAVKTRAEKKGREWILNGQKMWITNGGVANWYFVLARTNPDPKVPVHKALSGFIVERNSPGVTPGRKEQTMGQRASDTRGVSFEDVRIPEENLLLGEGAGFEIAMKTFDATRSQVAASSTGLSRRCLDEAAKYASERKTFGVPIIEHQAVAGMLADMAVAIELSQLSWMKAAWEYDSGMRNTYLSSISKVYATEAANKCAKDAVQIFGGNGYSADYPVEKLMRDAKILEIYEGTNEVQKLIIGRLIKKKVKESH